MTSRAPLHLVNSETGEILQDDRDLLIEQLQNELKGKSLQIGKLKRELRELRAVEPESETIREILAYWQERCSPRSAIAPGGKRWEKVRARLREKLDGRDPLTPNELKLAVDGALLDRWHTQRGHRLDAEFLFRSYESVERLRDQALGFDAKAGIGLGDLLDVATELHFVDWKLLLRVCCCDHRRVEHSRPDDGWGQEGCLIPGCDCLDFSLDVFDPWNQKTDEWLKRWAA